MNRNTNFAKTKIIGTIGPASGNSEVLKKLINAGMDIARLNFSHGTYKDHETSITNILKASEETGSPLPILLDLCGPKIRIGTLKEEFYLNSGDTIIISTDELIGTKEKISTIYKNLPNDVNPGDNILIDDGLIKLKVLKTNSTEVTCKVIDEGLLKSKKGINLPGVAISSPTITEKDRKDIEFGLNHDIDFFALSFVRSADDIKELKTIIKAGGKEIPVIAKIEKPEAIENIDAILQETDLIMVARGDLGVEMKTEEVPILQKMLIEKANKYNKPVITATQMLESMIENSRPTRAEASDVANAVFDGTDAVMLSAETSVGKRPVETVRIMDTIIRAAEQRVNPLNSLFLRRSDTAKDQASNICRAAGLLAENSKAAAIIVITKTGRTAQVLSRYRINIPIIAFTENYSVVKKLNIIWGVQGELIDKVLDTDFTLKKTRDLALKLGYVKHGDSVIYIAGIPLIESSQTNMIKMEKIE